MANAVNKNRPRRINNDGKSITETRLVGPAALLPGTFVVISPTTDKFTIVGTDAVDARLYILNVDTIQGNDILTPVPVDESGVGDYVEPVRQFAALVKASTVCIKDTKLYLDAATGILTSVKTGDAPVIAYSQEVYTVPAGAAGHVLIRTV